MFLKVMKWILVTGSVCILLGAAGSLQADVYSYTDSSGVRHLTNIPPANDSRYELVLRSDATKPKGWTGSTYWSNPQLNRSAYAALIAREAARHGVDPELVRAVIHAESAFNSRAVSPMGALGLMQLMPATADRFQVRDVFDPEENIRGGVAYLAFLLRLFDGDRRLAVAAYNAGEGAVQRYNGIPPFKETTNYVARVMDLHRRYQRETVTGVDAQIP